jgi:hypothetical protein
MAAGHSGAAFAAETRLRALAGPAPAGTKAMAHHADAQRLRKK